MYIKKQQLEPDMDLQTGFQIGKGVHQGCILLPCLFILNSEYILQNARLDESQAEIKIAGRNISNLKYSDDTTPMASCEEELKSLLMMVKENSEKADLKFSIQKTKIMASGPFPSCQIDREKVETFFICKIKKKNRFYFLGLQNHCGHDCNHELENACSLGAKL